MNSCRWHRVRRMRQAGTVILLGLIVWQWGAALQLQAKAVLAQILIGRAWTEKLQAPTETAAPWPWADTEPVGRLQWLDKGETRTDQYVLAGTGGNSLAFGPGLTNPGDNGPALVIAGHRDTHFAFLQQLQAGDLLRWQDSSGRWHLYSVDTLTVVNSEDELFWLDPQENVLWLITCYPFDALQPGGPLRYVVRAEQRQYVTRGPIR